MTTAGRFVSACRVAAVEFRHTALETAHWRVAKKIA
jgi:hypothetical protein